MSEEKHAEQLAKTRDLAHRVQKEQAKYVKGATVHILSLVTYINPFMDWFYGIALALAMLKDILDVVLIGSVLGIGTVITTMCSMVIGFIMLITGSFSTARWARRFGILLIGTFVEIVFGINFLPVETTIVIIVFYMTLSSRAEAEKKRAEELQQLEMAQENLVSA